MKISKKMLPDTNCNLKITLFYVFCVFLIGCNNLNGQKNIVKDSTALIKKTNPVNIPKPTLPPVLDTSLFKKALLRLVKDTPAHGWPVKTAYPLPGALLPNNRIVAYYGNFYSAGMGILGELQPDTMLQHLMNEVKKWQKADTLTPVIPALHYIAVTAQSRPGKGNKYRLRMPFTEIDKALDLAKKINAIVFLDVQVGQSTVQAEIPMLEKYLLLSNVHLAIDPEFSMKTGNRPGTVIGSYDAEDINYVTGYLAELVRKNNLPPKILVVHRFTKGMVTNYKKITIRPEVQLVMDMDGWGFPAKKVNSYKLAIYNEPVQFTGFKLFYKNDILTSPWKTIMKPDDALKLYPKPIYIQYQ